MMSSNSMDNNSLTMESTGEMDPPPSTETPSSGGSTGQHSPEIPPSPVTDTPIWVVRQFSKFKNWITRGYNKFRGLNPDGTPPSTEFREEFIVDEMTDKTSGLLNILSAITGAATVLGWGISSGQSWAIAILSGLGGDPLQLLILLSGAFAALVVRIFQSLTRLFLHILQFKVTNNVSGNKLIKWLNNFAVLVTSIVAGIVLVTFGLAFVTAMFGSLLIIGTAALLANAAICLGHIVYHLALYMRSNDINARIRHGNQIVKRIINGAASLFYGIALLGICIGAPYAIAPLLIAAGTISVLSLIYSWRREFVPWTFFEECLRFYYKITGREAELDSLKSPKIETILADTSEPARNYLSNTDIAVINKLPNSAEEKSKSIISAAQLVIKRCNESLQMLKENLAFRDQRKTWSEILSSPLEYLRTRLTARSTIETKITLLECLKRCMIGAVATDSTQSTESQNPSSSGNQGKTIAKEVQKHIDDLNEITRLRDLWAYVNDGKNKKFLGTALSSFEKRKSRILGVFELAVVVTETFIQEQLPPRNLQYQAPAETNNSKESVLTPAHADAPASTLVETPAPSSQSIPTTSVIEREENEEEKQPANLESQIESENARATVLPLLVPVAIKISSEAAKPTKSHISSSPTSVILHSGTISNPSDSRASSPITPLSTSDINDIDDTDCDDDTPEEKTQTQQESYNQSPLTDLVQPPQEIDGCTEGAPTPDSTPKATLYPPENKSHNRQATFGGDIANTDIISRALSGRDWKSGSVVAEENPENANNKQDPANTLTSRPDPLLGISGVVAAAESSEDANNKQNPTNRLTRWNASVFGITGTASCRNDMLQGHKKENDDSTNPQMGT